MQISVTETLKWIRETYLIAEKPAQNLLGVEIRQTKNPSHQMVIENFDENFNT